MGRVTKCLANQPLEFALQVFDSTTELLTDDLSAVALPLYLIAVLVEAALAWRGQLMRYHWPDTLASLAMLLVTAVVEVLPRAAALLLFAWLHELSPLRDVVGRQWWAWVLLFVLDDAIYYAFHRCNHEIRLFWAGHVNHHSSEYLNFGTALRQGVGERLHKFVFWLPLPLLGFDVLMIVAVMSLSLFYQFWIHTQSIDRLPKFIEAVFNTPSHHRVHHASNLRYLDRNHGGVLIIWDRLFGTFAPELASDPPVYGLTHNLGSHNPWVVLTHEYKALLADVSRAPTWQVKWRYLLWAPGWSHDGPDQRANTLRQQR